jgi:Rps23 Pro-64 3,4-dihydroxylase Tpa1-like proline 4-hydroxylase
LDTPPDAPFALQEWHVTNEQRFVPQFNSLLVMRLDTRYAHGVQEVTGDQPRLALVGIYGRA